MWICYAPFVSRARLQTGCARLLPSEHKRALHKREQHAEGPFVSRHFQAPFVVCANGPSPPDTNGASRLCFHAVANGTPRLLCRRRWAMPICAIRNVDPAIIASASRRFYTAVHRSHLPVHRSSSSMSTATSKAEAALEAHRSAFKKLILQDDVSNTGSAHLRRGCKWARSHLPLRHIYARPQTGRARLWTRRPAYVSLHIPTRQQRSFTD